MEDVTHRNALIREKEDLLQQKDVLLYELRHRISNSLQIIASIILLKSKTVESEETRGHLKDAHSRVMSIAEVQNQLQVKWSRLSEQIFRVDKWSLCRG
jgi:chemotaxis protein methyltransferase CheR